MRNFWFFPLLVCVFITAARGIDPVQALIKQEQQSLEAWTEENKETVLPPGFFRPSNEGVEVYSYWAHRGEDNSLCTPLPLDELAEVSNLPSGPGPQILNLRLPRVRDFLSQHCLLRPNDFFLAVGKKESRFLQVKDFVLERAPSPCPGVPQEILSAQFTEAPPGSVLFYAVSSDWDPGLVSWTPRGDLKKIELTSEQRTRIENEVPFLNEYRVEGWEIPDSLGETLVKVSRKKTTLDDVLLIHQAVLFLSTSTIQVLGLERVRRETATGSVELEGVLDFNRDGKRDVHVSLSRGNCRQNFFFKNGDAGPEVLNVPNEACDCAEIAVETH